HRRLGIRRLRFAPAERGFHGQSRCDGHAAFILTATQGEPGMRNLLQARSARKAQTPAFTAAPQASNVRGISITDTGTGARVGVLLAGAADSGTNVESLSLQVHIEYGDRRQKDIDVLMRDALHEALRVIQHELNVCAARSAT